MLPGYNPPEGKVFAMGAVEITKWLLAQTLLCVADAHAAARIADAQDATQVMLSKIREFGPITVWELRRHYKVQNSEVHQPVLETLLEAGKVHLNESGKLIAA